MNTALESLYIVSIVLLVPATFIGFKFKNNFRQSASLAAALTGVLFLVSNGAPNMNQQSNKHVEAITKQSSLATDCGYDFPW